MHFRGRSSSSSNQGPQSRREALQVSSESPGNYISLVVQSARREGGKAQTEALQVRKEKNHSDP